MRPDSPNRRHHRARPSGALALLIVVLLMALLAGAALAHARTGATHGDRAVPRAFTLASITPNTAATGEAVTATIAGSGFELNGRYQVDLTMGATTVSDNAAARRPDTLVVKLVLTGAPPGGYDLTVTDVRSSESHTLAGAFTVTASPSPSPGPTTAKPIIASISPTKGARGSKVTIKGSNFGKPRGTGYVKFGAKKCTKYVSWSAAKIVCKVPAKAAFARVKVRVTTSAGASNSKNFTVKKN